MDNLFIDAVDKPELDSNLRFISVKLRNDYEAGIKVSLISYEKTIHEGLPATFLIYKIESRSKFGYYFFYINDQTEKILLVSEFSRIKDKRIF